MLIISGSYLLVVCYSVRCGVSGGWILCSCLILGVVMLFRYCFGFRCFVRCLVNCYWWWWVGSWFGLSGLVGVGFWYVLRIDWWSFVCFCLVVNLVLRYCSCYLDGRCWVVDCVWMGYGYELLLDVYVGYRCVNCIWFLLLCWWSCWWWWGLLCWFGWLVFVKVSWFLVMMLLVFWWRCW